MSTSDRHGLAPISDTGQDEFEFSPVILFIVGYEFGFVIHIKRSSPVGVLLTSQHAQVWLFQSFRTIAGSFVYFLKRTKSPQCLQIQMIPLRKKSKSSTVDDKQHNSSLLKAQAQDSVMEPAKPSQAHG